MIIRIGMWGRFTLFCFRSKNVLFTEWNCTLVIPPTSHNRRTDHPGLSHSEANHCCSARFVLENVKEKRAEGKLGRGDAEVPVDIVLRLARLVCLRSFCQAINRGPSARNNYKR